MKNVQLCKQGNRSFIPGKYHEFLLGRFLEGNHYICASCEHKSTILLFHPLPLAVNSTERAFLCVLFFTVLKVEEYTVHSSHISLLQLTMDPGHGPWCTAAHPGAPWAQATS